MTVWTGPRGQYREAHGTVRLSAEIGRRARLARRKQRRSLAGLMRDFRSITMKWRV